MSKYKIAFIVPYFGKMNNYFDLWLTSCKNNPTIDWIIFTDDKYEYKYPPNVKVHYITFEEMKNKVQSKFDFNISLSNPYKLCDYKVTYGEVFEEYLQEYDFWGYCDTDTIWGNIRKFITDDVLKVYDKVLDSGHFSIYKNNYTLNTAYKRLTCKDCYNYKEVFTSDDSYAFDEWGKNKGINRILLNNGFKIYYDKILFSDIKVNKYSLRNTREDYGTDEIKNFEKLKRYIAFEYKYGNLIQYSIKDDEIIKNEELYIHLQKRPMKKNTSDYSEEFIIIAPNKIITSKEKINKEFLMQHCKEHGIYTQYYKILYSNIKRRLYRYFNKI